jgi:hypothetical protein
VPEDLDRALILYARYPGGVSHRGRAALGPAFGPDEVAVLVPMIEALVAEIFAIPVDWNQSDLSVVLHVQSEFQRRHPEIGEEAARALANYWSYCNR